MQRSCGDKCVPKCNLGTREAGVARDLRARGALIFAHPKRDRVYQLAPCPEVTGYRLYAARIVNTATVIDRRYNSGEKAHSRVATAF